MTGVYNNPDRPPVIKFYGEAELCKPYIKEGKRQLQKYNIFCDQNNLDINVGIKRVVYPDGTNIHVGKRFELFFVDIFSAGYEDVEINQVFFQCDLYEDDPGSPGDLSAQTKSSIFFTVINPSWAVIPERQGNYEWIGIDDEMVSWDATQNWGVGIANKKAWNDGLKSLEPSGNTISDWDFPPYIPPEHAKRPGEITTLITNYPADLQEIKDDPYLFNLNHRLVFEKFDEVNDPDVHKQTLFVNGLKYDIQFTEEEYRIVGSCLHTLEGTDVTWCVVVTQPYSIATDKVGWHFGYEDVWYFQVDETNLIPTPISILRIYENQPNEAAYGTHRADITPWRFKSNGLQGCAFRTNHFFLQAKIVSGGTVYGPYSYPRFVYLELTYTRGGVSATTWEDSSVTETIAQVTLPDGVDASSGDVDELAATFSDWINRLLARAKMNDVVYGIIDIDYFEGEFTTLGYYTSSATEITGEQGDPYYSQLRESTVYIANSFNLELWKKINSGLIELTSSGGSSVGRRYTAYPTTENMWYVGGSVRDGIHFFVKSTFSGDIINNHTTLGTQESVSDNPYLSKVKLVCIFKDQEFDIGSEIEYLIPIRFDEDGTNSNIELPVIGDSEDGNYFSICSHFNYSPVQGPLPWRYIAAATRSDVVMGDFGGSIKCSPDGTHAVVSCSYMDIAKFLYGWHRFIWDVDVTNTTNTSGDTMTGLGIPQATQDAWNKYMINYAIIQDEDNEDLIEVKQLSNLLFGKAVIDEDENPSFGIKEKDTTAFLPIGLYKSGA